jgi:hypothetical protein
MGDSVVHRHPVFAALILLVVCGFSCVAGDAVAQEWATKMFKDTSHNFGTVAKNAKVEYRFRFYNPYKETVHVAAVSTSCHCTEPEIEKDTVVTYDQGAIVAKFNTRLFSGNHSATITVTIDKPYYAAVLLSVWGDIRGDLEVQSQDGTGAIDFGTIQQGDPAVRRLTVINYSRSDWQISDVRSVNSSYEVQVANGQHSPGRSSYDLVVKLKKDAKPGYLHDPLILVTNDSQTPQFPIEVQGVVQAELNVRPEKLVFGTVEAGQQVTKPLIVTGHKAFNIKSVTCDDESLKDSFKFEIKPGAPRVHMINVTFSAPNKPGKLVKTIKIQTDLGNSLGVNVVAEADVTAAPGATPETPPSDAAAPKNETTKSSTANASSSDDSAAKNVIKLDTGSGLTPSASSVERKNADASVSGTTGSSISAPADGGDASAVKTPARVLKRASEIPNPIRSKGAAPSISENSASLN